MANNPKDNISSRTSDKKHGALYDQDAKHVESQDDLKESTDPAENKTSEEE